MALHCRVLSSRSIAGAKQPFDSLTYCHCSAEFNTRFFSAALGQKVQVELARSILCGAESCQCKATIRNDQWDADEIAASGLTAEPAAAVNAPRIRECFLALECEYLWEREVVAGEGPTMVCLKVKNVCMDEVHLDEAVQGRYGETGYLYNIHNPVNPETHKGKSRNYIAVLQKLRDMGDA